MEEQIDLQIMHQHECQMNTSEKDNLGYLPNDYSRCNNNECKLKLSCLRWLDNLPFDPDGYYYVMRFIPNDIDCEHIISKRE